MNVYQGQALVVTTADWECHRGIMRLFDGGREIEWFPVTLGKNGLSLDKKEGDGTSPAGTFPVLQAFSHEKIPGLKMEWIKLTEYHEAVDDPKSQYYNQIVDNREVVPDWSSSEKMSLYEAGLIIGYNWPNPESYKGSAIFIHEWEGSGKATSGCTGMSKKNFYKLLKWLDPHKQPVLVQFPICYNSEL